MNHKTNIKKPTYLLEFPYNILQFVGAPMSFKREEKSLKKEEIKSMENAVKDAGIGAIHPDKMEEWAEHLVRKLAEDKEAC